MHNSHQEIVVWQVGKKREAAWELVLELVLVSSIAGFDSDSVYHKVN
jgi:hypothetical protein